MPPPTNHSTASNGASNARVAEQIYVTHCLREDSLLGREGFSARAASSSDTNLLHWALALDAYELPFDMKSGSLLLSQTPRRLAMVPAPGDRVGLVHSAYLAEDTRGRPHSYMSHALVYQELGVLEAAASWGATSWQTDEYERGRPQTLSPFTGVPHGDAVGEAALVEFLAGKSGSADQSLASVVFPSRVERDPQARARWLRSSLHGFLRGGARYRADEGVHTGRARGRGALDLRHCPLAAAPACAEFHLFDVRAAAYVAAREQGRPCHRQLCQERARS